MISIANACTALFLAQAAWTCSPLKSDVQHLAPPGWPVCGVNVVTDNIDLAKEINLSATMYCTAEPKVAKPCVGDAKTDCALQY